MTNEQNTKNETSPPIHPSVGALWKGEVTQSVQDKFTLAKQELEVMENG